jgi:hypothetical protein
MMLRALSDFLAFTMILALGAIAWIATP